MKIIRADYHCLLGNAVAAIGIFWSWGQGLGVIYYPGYPYSERAWIRIVFLKWHVILEPARGPA